MSAIIVFHHIQKHFKIKNLKGVKKLIITIFDDQRLAIKRIDYIFCKDDYLLQINRQFLSHNYLTDIITFPLNDPGKPITGEVYISLDRVQENAEIFKVTKEHEALRVIFHGALHLAGFLDKTKNEKALMRKKEDMYIGRFFNVSRDTVSLRNSVT